MNPIFEIRRKIKEFELLTGFTPNSVIVSRWASKTLDAMLEGRSALIEQYPDVFQLSIRTSYSVKDVEVQLVLN